MSTRGYVIPYAALLKQIGVVGELSGTERVELTRDQLTLLIRSFLASVPVDEVWYKATYQDIDEAIRSGTIKSAKEHFISDGYFEGRLPCKILVDEEFYVSQYPDVAEGIDDGEISSAQEHFESNGFGEGRLPFAI